MTIEGKKWIHALTAVYYVAGLQGSHYWAALEGTEDEKYIEEGFRECEGADWFLWDLVW